MSCYCLYLNRSLLGCGTL